MRANEAISSEFLPPSPPNSADRADSLLSGKANIAARTTYTHIQHTCERRGQRLMCRRRRCRFVSGQIREFVTARQGEEGAECVYSVTLLAKDLAVGGKERNEPYSPPLFLHCQAPLLLLLLLLLPTPS